MDIYVTGSNSKLLSSEISTLLTGKNIVIKVYPLTFSEMQEYYDEGKVDSLNERFNDFFTFGGMPGRTNFNDKTKIYNYLNMIYGDILQNDILSKKAVLDVNELTNIYRLIFDNIGKELSYKNIYEKLKNNNSTISQNTIVKYVELLQNSFLVQKINKFDLSGKKILENLYKYYPMDFGMRNAMFKNFSHNRGKILENIVLNELKYRGYEVFIGTSRTISEIDFVAKNNNEILYFQVCETITEDNIERETTPLTKINNSFPKIVLSLDTLESNDQNVIQFKNIIN
jgi:predicted AAA+ superfamily ATPase